MRIVKYGSSGCGPCSRMSHYDEKVVKELGLDFEYVKKRTPEYNSPDNEEIKKQLGGFPASPTYALVEGTNVLGSFSGGTDKGKFRERVQDLIAGFDGGDEDKHCTEFEGCDDFYWDCKPEREKICRPKKGKEKFYVRLSTHGCNNGCDEQGGGKELTYEWREADGTVIDKAGSGKEAEFEVGPDTPIGTLEFIGVAFCKDHPKNKELTHKFKIVVEDCTEEPTPEPEPEPEPEPTPEPLPEYDCKCPPETIQLWYDQDRGVYGSTYDKDRISSIQFIDAWKDKKRKLKLWLRPGGCNLDDVCECVALCSMSTAGGYEVTGLDPIKCETNEKENSVTLQFKGTWEEPAKEEGEGDAETEPLLWVGPERCDPKVEYIKATSGKICPKGSGEVVEIEVSTSCCEPNDAQFRIDPDGKGMQNMRGMGGVSFPNAGGGPNDHGDGKEIKNVRIKCDEFPYDIADHDWKIRWSGNCDQSPGESVSGEENFSVSSGCGDGGGDGGGDEDECKTDEDCPSGQICVDGKCVEGCNDDEDCPSGQVCVDGKCVDEFSEETGSFYPNCLSFQCCADCDDEIPPFEPGDNDDCNNKPEPNPLPGTDGTAATVYLYDRLNHTFVFCCPILADVTWLLPFDAIPPIFQRYITAAATVRAAAQLVNNPQLFQLLKDRENTLRMECMNYELEQGDLNFLGQPDHTAYVGYQPIQTLNR